MQVNTKETKADRVARLAREKVRHDTAVTVGWPAVRRPRTAAEVETSATRSEMREHVLDAFAHQVPRHVTAENLGISWRRVVALRRKPRLHPKQRRAQRVVAEASAA